ncbi:MAG: M56 family metallopeptidase [Acidobacteriota bacterium]
MWNAVQGWWSADLLEVSLQATLLAGVVGVLASLLRESDPRLRHGLWLLVVLRLALPLNLQSPVGVLDREVTEGLVPTVVETPRSAPPAALPIDAGEAYRGLPAGGPPEHAAMVGPPLDVRRLGFLLWIFGALAVGAWALGSVLRLRRVVGESSPDRALSERAEELAAQHGVLSAPVLLSERENLGPLLAGLWRPQVVLPKSALDWPAAERDATLLHELAHLSRRDLWAVPLLAIARALHWFNPVVWFAARQVAAERELCCDDWVLRRRDVPKDYTRALLRGGLGTRSEAGVGMAAPRSRLLKRVRRLLSSEYRPPRLRRLATLCAVGVAGWAAFSFASPTEEDRPIETLEHRFAPSERVSGRIGLRGYYLPTPYGELGARRPWSGGRGLRPAERRWADVLPELPSDFSAKYTMDLILDAEGKVASLQTRAADSEDPAATEFVGTLEAGARQLRWRPIVHSVHGPVSADLSVSVEVRPSVEIETLRLAQRRPLGQLMSWLVEDDSGMVGPQAPQESDHFLSLLGEPELPSLVAWDEAFYGDYSMLLQVSPDGSVESSQVQGTPRRALLRREPGRNLQDLRETIEAWGSELRFEQLETETEKVIGAGVSLDLRFDASGIAIITYEAPESGWDSVPLDSLKTMS